MHNIGMMQLICACFAITRAELVVGLDQINAKYVPSVILEVNLFASNHANQANSLSRENAYLAIKNVSHATVLTTTSVIHALLIQILAWVSITTIRNARQNAPYNTIQTTL